jgi:transcription initiation factor TFIIH subunit 2
MAAFERLIRFESQEGKTVYGNLETEVPTREIEGRSVEVLEGDVKGGFKKTGRKATVGKVCLCLLTRSVLTDFSLDGHGSLQSELADLRL